ncbi:MULTISPECIES: helix-turn-helix domain-containing protein [Nocardia]|uniref:helix-turn-helix domain-containing protein n=1 Tax=Nocardia TaxID=1817 RepID=UPI00338FF5B6
MDLKRAAEQRNALRAADGPAVSAPIVSPCVRIRYSRLEAAAQLSISVSTLDRLRRTGRLIARTDGGRVFFDSAELESYAKSCPAEGR